MKFYGLKNCDTCRKALKDIAASGREVEVIDVREAGLSQSTIKGWIDEVGVETLVNRRSTTWRGLSAEEKETAMGDRGGKAGAASVLAANPTLIKRPVIEHDGTITVGWTAAQQKAWM